jgi:NADPH:quinone reductase-like Zn-dependent oxidoreductase
MGILKPKRPILGLEVAGQIEEVGDAVHDFKVGDHVFGGTGMRFGAHAEYTCLKTKFLAKKPDRIGYDQVVSIPTAGTNALHYIRLANVQPGEHILINGAAGCFGTYAVQFAKHFGAEVTAVDHGDKLESLREIGADYVIDYTQEDFTKNNKTYDIIFDVVGKTVSKNMESLKPHGRYVLATPWVIQVLQGKWKAMTTKKKFMFALASENQNDLHLISKLIVAGTIKPVLKKRFTLEQVKEAHQFIESGSKIGNVVIDINVQ